MPEPFKLDRQIYGDDLCAAAEVVSDQIEVAKQILRHHFPQMVDFSPEAVLDTQRCIEHALSGSPLMFPIDPSELEDQESPE